MTDISASTQTCEETLLAPSAPLHSRIALGIEYDGSVFHGWQRQRNGLETVQATLETALSELAGGVPIVVHSAGRTDAGVHATGQVVHFDVPCKRPLQAWVRGTNTLLPQTIRVLWARSVPKDFDARRSALSRTYHYLIYSHPSRPSLYRQYATWTRHDLDVLKLNQAAQYWCGIHDFSSFRDSDCQSLSPIRVVEQLAFIQKGRLMIGHFQANAFLHHMIRNMMGVLLEIGAGKKPVTWAKEVLVAENRQQAATTLAPNGLYLSSVSYPEAFDLPCVAGPPWLVRGGSTGEENLV